MKNKIKALGITIAIFMGIATFIFVYDTYPKETFFFVIMGMIAFVYYMVHEGLENP